jgi:predicted RNase H-like HicB family nuclease
MKYTFTAVYVDGEEGWINAYLEELQGVHGQGRTIEEARQSLHESLELVLRFNRAQTKAAFGDARPVHRETLRARQHPFAARLKRGASS